jgi:hypothetical protein
MAEKYYSILTNRGKELEAQSSATGKPVIIKDFVVGDGNGQAVKPDPAQTKLVREVYRNAISALQVSPDQANQFLAQLVLPVGVGGFVVREVGLLTDAGELYSVANSAAIEKPENGVSVSLQYRLAVSESANIELKVATGDGLFLRIDKNLAEIAAKGEAAQKSSREAIGVLDATTARKGLVQLSSVTNSSSEALAATPKAVKAAYDLANGKYTAQDATTAQKGIVQLSSATDSTSEVLAATPKAVSTAAKEIRDDLRTAAFKDVVTSQTDTTAGRVLNVGYGGLGGTAPRTPVAGAANYDNIPTGLPSGYWTHAVDGGPYAHTLTLLQDGGGSRDDRHLIIPSSNAGKIALRWDSGNSKYYQYFYTDKNKPTAADVEALPASQNSLSVDLNTLGTMSSNGVYYQTSNAGATAANHYPAQQAGTLYVTRSAYGCQQMYITYSNRIFIRALTGSWSGSGPWSGWAEMYGPNNKPSSDDVSCIQRDGAHIGGFASGDVARPYMRHTASGTAVILAKVGDSYTKAESDNGYMPKTGAYTKTESDGRFQPKGNYTPAGQAYTKAESDGRYQPKGNYTPAGQAYTKNESDAKYPTGFRIGARTRYNGSDYSGKIPQGAVNICDFTDGDNRINGTMYAYPQYLINGNWYNFS